MTAQESRPGVGTEAAAKFTGGRTETDSSALDDISRCRACRHPLRAEQSIHRGMGPVCHRRHVALLAAGGGRFV